MDAIPYHASRTRKPGCPLVRALSRGTRRSYAIIWQDNWTEGESLYFLDPNGHKLEIHASDLAARLQAARENPWAGLELFTET